MTFLRLRLGVAAALFLAWTAWLVYQVATTANPIVVSRPQIFLAPVIIEAQVPEGMGSAREVTVTHVYRGHQFLGVAAGAEPPPGLKLTIRYWGDVDNWKGAGNYILALQKSPREQAGGYELLSIPFGGGVTAPGAARLTIYPVTASTRAQVEEALRDSAEPVALLEDHKEDIKAPSK
jgi:hypothetical protein